MKKNNTNILNKTADMILIFPTPDKLAGFFGTDILNKYGVASMTFGSTVRNEISVTDVNVVVLAEIITEAQKYGGKHILNCGGKNLDDCADYEKKCGSICDYCQYMELDMKSNNGDNV